MISVNNPAWLGYGNGIYDTLDNGTYESIQRLNGAWYVATGNVAQSDWLTFGALLVLSLVCMLLAWKSHVPILNFVFGAITLGAGAYYLGSAMVFAGWINLLAIVMAVLCMLTGAIKLREM